MWHIAAAALPPLDADAVAVAAAAGPLAEAEIEAKRQTAEATLENEARVFQNDLGECFFLGFSLGRLMEFGGRNGRFCLR